MKLRLALALIGVVTLAAIVIGIGGNLWIGFRPEKLPGRPIQAATPEGALCAPARAALESLRPAGCLPGEAGRWAAAGRVLHRACCTAMNLAQYKRQLHGLKSYRAVGLVPTDPYDVSVRLAAQLLAYDRAIELKQADQRQYDQAVRLSKEHGPCCCHCWRWSAFAGQAKRLIAHSHYRAREVARLWDLEDGCGGPA